jgi:leader peptidase (prepilin peptidase)/N-methyltransferase
MYPVVELATGLIWLGAFLYLDQGFTALRVAVFATILMGAAVTDARHYLIPDGFTATALVWVMATALVAQVTGTHDLFATPYDALVGACTGAGAIAIAGWIGEMILRKEAMGFGDVTLMAAAGAALGPTRALLTIFIGALVGAVSFLLVVYPIGWVRSRKSGAGFEPPLVPFGVFLAPSAVICLLWGNAMMDWYLAYVGISR